MLLIGNAWRQTLSADAEMALPKKICSLNRRRTFLPPPFPSSSPSSRPLPFSNVGWWCAAGINFIKLIRIDLWHSLLAWRKACLHRRTSWLFYAPTTRLPPGSYFLRPLGDAVPVWLFKSRPTPEVVGWSCAISSWHLLWSWSLSKSLPAVRRRKFSFLAQGELQPRPPCTPFSELREGGCSVGAS